jgi:hypothetical protein
MISVIFASIVAKSGRDVRNSSNSIRPKRAPTLSTCSWRGAGMTGPENASDDFVSDSTKAVSLSIFTSMTASLSAAAV